MKLVKSIAICSAVFFVVNVAQGEPLYQVPFNNAEVRSDVPIYADFNFDPVHQSIICSTQSPMSTWSFAYVQWTQEDQQHTQIFKKHHPVILKDIVSKGQLRIGYDIDGGISSKQSSIISVSCNYQVD